MNGRLEQENKLKEKINEKLAGLPKIFSSFYHYMEADQKSYATIKHYIEYVSDFMNYVSKTDNLNEFYKDISISDIRAYIISLKSRVVDGKEVKNSDSIQATRWSAINTFFNFLVMDDYISVNPMTKTKRPKNRKEKPIVYLEQEETNEILNKIRAESKKQFVNRDLLLITLGIATGLRVGALVQINVEDIDFTNNTIHVIEKGAKDRYVRFGQNTRNALAAWLIDRDTYFKDADTNALFVSQWKQRMTVEAVRKLMKKYADGINGKHIVPHTMRKSTATNLAKEGVDVQTIREILNHQSVQTTLKYTAVFDESKQKATDILDMHFQ